MITPTLKINPKKIETICNVSEEHIQKIVSKFDKKYGSIKRLAGLLKKKK